MGKRLAIISGALAAWILIPVAAHAFEQQQTAPAMQPAPSVAPQTPAVELDKMPAAPQPEKSKGLKLPGIGNITIPKLDFGLDLMYGSQDNKRDTELQFAPIEPTNEDDVRIMGKVKRRF